MITGWLAGEDCPDCGGPLLETSCGPRYLTLECPGCGYYVTWNTADPDTDSADPEDQEN
jgi:uncharacterized Zn finger protein (UPF0148 family)